MIERSMKINKIFERVNTISKMVCFTSIRNKDNINIEL